MKREKKRYDGTTHYQGCALEHPRCREAWVKRLKVADGIIRTFAWHLEAGMKKPRRENAD